MNDISRVVLCGFLPGLKKVAFLFIVNWKLEESQITGVPDLNPALKRFSFP